MGWYSITPILAKRVLLGFVVVAGLTQTSFAEFTHEDPRSPRAIANTNGGFQSAALTGPSLGIRPDAGFGGGNSGAGGENDSYKRITDLADQNKSCKNTKISNRGSFASKEGYYHGMVLTFARSVCRPKDAAKLAMLNSKQSPDPAGVSRASLGSDDAEKNALADRYGLLMAHGMMESSGNYREGRDKSARNTKAETAEAGLFQTSESFRGYFKSGKGGPNALAGLEQIEKQYASLDPKMCMTDVFGKSAKGKGPSTPVGKGKGTELQKLLLNCPAAAVEHAAISTQNKRHYGPLKKGLQAPKPCVEMLKNVYDEVSSNRESICSGLGVSPGGGGGGGGGTQTASRSGGGRG